MKITFLLRRDAKEKPGGDTSKVERYLERLHQLGISATVTSDRGDLPRLRPDLVHLINLDLPAENLANAKAARRIGARVALSTIRHPFGGVKDFYGHGEDRLYRRLRALRVSAERGIGLRELVKLSAARDRGAFHALQRYSSAQERLLQAVDVVLPMAPGEARSLSDDFLFDAPMKEVRNALSFTTNDRPSAQPTRHLTYDAAVIGRIEPRKNSLALAQLATREPSRTVVFAGQMNERHPQYAKEFLRLANTAPNIVYAGKVKHQRVREILETSSAYINPAWFEVVSQADFEAVSLGLPILTTTQSYLGDFISGGGWVDPADHLVHGRDSSFSELLARAQTAQLLASRRSWDQAGDELKCIYEEIL